MKTKSAISNSRVAAYLDTLVGFNETDPVSIKAYQGNRIVLDSVFELQVVAVECQRKQDSIPSFMIWGFVENEQKFVTGAECFFSENHNRLYDDWRCTLLTPNGRMIRQCQWSLDSIAVEYRDWLRLFEDGTPQLYPHCNDAIWENSWGGFWQPTEQWSQSFGHMISDSGIVNKIRTDFFKRQQPCRELLDGNKKPRTSYVLTSVHGRKGEMVVVVLQNDTSRVNKNLWSLCIYRGDIYNMNDWSLVHTYDFEDSEDFLSSKLRMKENARGLIIEILKQGRRKMRFRVDRISGVGNP